MDNNDNRSKLAKQESKLNLDEEATKNKAKNKFSSQTDGDKVDNSRNFNFQAYISNQKPNCKHQFNKSN